jgi:Multicopper oxidase
LDGPVTETLTVDTIRSVNSTALPTEARVYDVKLVLDGDMARYVWHINGKTIQQDRTIQIQEGDIVRFRFVNNTMMHHPMHLHGHFFRVLNDGGAHSPLKHTVDVSPHSSRTIEFYANEPGEWMLHCHNLYHLKTGMARVVKYSSFTPSREIAHLQKHDPHNHDHIYSRGRVDAATNLVEGRFSLLQTWNQLDFRGETRRDGDSWDEEADLLGRRWVGKFFSVIAGGTVFDEKGAASAGVGYLLPMLIQADAFVDHRGDTRLDLAKEFQWTKYVMSETEIRFRESQKAEWKVSLMYAPTWSSAMGLVFTEDGPGVGLRYQF